jgi:hypothetical protein
VTPRKVLWSYLIVLVIAVALTLPSIASECGRYSDGYFEFGCSDFISAVSPWQYGGSVLILGAGIAVVGALIAMGLRGRAPTAASVAIWLSAGLLLFSPHGTLFVQVRHGSALLMGAIYLATAIGIILAVAAGVSLARPRSGQPDHEALDRVAARSSRQK